MRALTALCAIIALGALIAGLSIAGPDTRLSTGQALVKSADASDLSIKGSRAQKRSWQSSRGMKTAAACIVKWEACDVADGTQRSCCQGLICTMMGDDTSPKCYAAAMRPE